MIPVRVRTRLCENSAAIRWLNISVYTKEELRLEYSSKIPITHYSQIRSKIRSGDLLLCSGSSIFSKLIQNTTNSPWSHVAFVLRMQAIDRILVLESVESIGVRAVILSSYIQNYNGTDRGYPGKILIARHADVK
jgi:hypothetical protein